MTSNPQPAIVRPWNSRELHAFGDVLTVVLSGADTGQSLTLMFGITPPVGGPPPHVHSKEDDLFLVVEGRVRFFVEGNWTEVAPGGTATLVTSSHLSRMAYSLPLGGSDSTRKTVSLRLFRLLTPLLRRSSSPQNRFTQSRAASSSPACGLSRKPAVHNDSSTLQELFTL